MDTYVAITGFGFIVLSTAWLSWFLLTIRKGVILSNLDEKKKKSILRFLPFSILVWLTTISMLSSLGLINDFSSLPPPFIIIVVVPLISILWATSSKETNEVIRNIHPSVLPTMQSFRIVVEIFLWLLFLANQVPVQMTFEGRNFDILVGILGPIVGFVLIKTKSLAVLRIYNFAGLILLLNIVSIAFLSTPSPIRIFMHEPANTIVAEFPFVFLPGILVPLAYTLHILSLKQAELLKRGG